MAAEVRSDLEMAAGVSFAGCDACHCGNLHIRLHDREGRIFAVALLRPMAAEVMHADIGKHLKQAKGGGLEAMVCEGVA